MDKIVATEKEIREAIKAINEFGCPECGGDFHELWIMGIRGLYCKVCGKKAE